MPRKRRSYPAELKAKVALEALREEATMAALVARYDVHPNLIANWKKQAREQVLVSFAGKPEHQEASREAEIKELRAKVGELVIERDFFVEGLRPLSHGRRVTMVDPDHVALSITRQCRLVSIARSSFYYEGTGESPLNLQLLRRIDEQFLETPFYGSRQMTRWLLRQGTRVSRKGSVARFGITRENPLGGPRYAANPNTLWISCVCPTTSPFAIHRACPLRSACMISMPRKVRHAVVNRLKPSIGRVRRLMNRWSCSMMLFRYLHWRRFERGRTSPSCRTASNATG